MRLTPSLAPSAGNAVCGPALASAARYLCDTATQIGEREQAREVCGRLRFRHESALTHLGMAEALFEDKEPSGRTEALQNVDMASAAFRDMKMDPSSGRRE
jgi:hypothetical protein